jgi:photosystem II stability/assembly factor-like uncharacterized protein
MKISIFFLIFLLALIPCRIINSQPQYIYTEQNSGVTSSLTSASMAGNYSLYQVWICGSGGVVLKTTNEGNNWISANNGIPNSLNLTNISCKARDTVLTTGNTGTTAYVFRTVNGGSNWSLVFTQPNGHINAIWMRNGLNGFMEGNPVGGRWSLWKTTNGGLNWDSAGMYIPQSGTETGWNNSLALMYNVILFGTNNSRIYKSTNSGQSFSYITTPEQNSTALWIYWDTVYVSFVYSGGNNIYASTNGGNNWTQISCPDTGSFNGFCPGYVGVESYPPMGVYAIRNNTKVYYSGSAWGNFYGEYTAPSGIYNHMAYDVGVSYWHFSWAVRSNGGITRISLFRGGAVTKLSSFIPADFSLSQNYPNPFNPNTNINFQISKTSDVKLIVFDVLGREIANIVNEQLLPGTYEIEWDGTNYPSGVYFYKLITAGYTGTRKMVLLK